MSPLLAFLPAGSPWLPAIVFVAELCVVTLGTLRIIFVTRGRRLLAPLLGFFEVVTWLFAISQIMRNLDNAWCFMAFAAGFTSGNLLGVLIERRLALGTVVVRVITNHGAGQLISELHAAGFGVTSLDGRGAAGAVQVVLTIVPRRDLPRVKSIIHGVDPKLFFSVDEIQQASEGVFPRGRAKIVPADIIPFRRAA